MLQSEGQVVTNPAVRYGAWLLFSGFLLWFVIFSSFSVGWLHLAKSIGPRVLGVKAGFTGAHAVSVSMLLALMNLRYWIFSNSTLTPIHAHYSQVSDQDSASNLLMLCSSYIVQVLLLATDVLLDTSSPGLCVQFSTDTAYKSTFQSDTKSLQVPCPGGIAAFSKLKLSSHSVFFIIKFYLQFTFFLQGVFPWGWWTTAADVWFNMNYNLLDLRRWLGGFWTFFQKIHESTGESLGIMLWFFMFGFLEQTQVIIGVNR